MPRRSSRRPSRARVAQTARGARGDLPDVNPRKSLGQHFLLDEQVLDGIVRLSRAGPGRRVVEIGAGLGALTEPLVEAGAKVLAVEIDEDLCSRLRRRFNPDDVQVACLDVLDFPPRDLLALAELEPPYDIVANLPYYITARILQHFLEADAPPERMTIMVQNEVAERIVAQPPKMSLLGVSVQAYAEPTFGFRVQPHAFFPPPKVDSAVVRLETRRHAALPDDVEPFFAAVRAGFRQPRKQLHNALPMGLWFPPGGVAAVLDDAGVDSSRRAQTLSIEEWARLADAYERARHRWRTEAP